MSSRSQSSKSPQFALQSLELKDTSPSYAKRTPYTVWLAELPDELWLLKQVRPSESQNVKKKTSKMQPHMHENLQDHRRF